MTYTYTGYGGGGAWNYRKLVTIPRTAISGNHTNLPVLFKIKEIGKKSGFADGTDIIFVATDASSRYKHDLISFKDYSGCAYIQIPSLVDQNGTTNAAQFYMYYGNDSENQLERVSFHPSSTWDSNYMFVCHMHDSGGNNQRLVDSTKYKVPLWKTTAGTPHMVKSFMGSAQLWDGDTSNKISSNTSSAFTGFKGQITVQAIISGGGGCGGTDSRGYLVNFHNKPTNTNSHTVCLNTRSTMSLAWIISSNYTTLGTAVASTWWPKKGNIANTTIFSLSYKSGNVTTLGHNRLYVEGRTLSDSNEETARLIDTNNKGIYMGQTPAATTYSWSGALLGVRVMNTTKSKGWHLTEYLNVSSIACNKLSKFYTIGAEEGVVGDVEVTDSTVDGVTVPVTGETPDTTVTECDQYTGTIAWSGTPTTFEASTVYTATITLSAKVGYTFTGVDANFFTVAGTSSPATNSADSGVVTAVFPVTQVETAIGNWYNTAWSYRKKANINRACVKSSQTSFPVLYKISNIGRNSLDNGTDIIFVGSGNSSTAGNRLHHELISFYGYTGNAWVQISSLTAGKDQVFYMYYGATSDHTQDTGYKPSGTWDSNYVFICHMKDSGTSNKTLVDSTKYKIPLWKTIAAKPTMVKTFLGSGQRFDPDDNTLISSNTNSSLKHFSGQITLELIVSGGRADEDYSGIFSFHNKPTDTEEHTAGLRLRTNHRFQWYVSSTTISSFAGTRMGNSTPNATYWPETGNKASIGVLGLTYRSGSTVATTRGLMRLYNEGKEIYNYGELDTPRLLDNNNLGVHIGQYVNYATSSFSGSILEARVLKVVKDASWFKMEYINVSSIATNNTNVFYSIAAAETAPAQTTTGLSTFDTVSGCKGVASAKDWKWGKVLYGTSSGMRSSRTDGAGLDWSWHTIDGEAGYYVPSGSPTGWKWCVEYAGSS